MSYWRSSMSKVKSKRGDYLLMLLYADNQSPLVGRTRLQKIAFLFEKEILKKYEFDKKFELEEVMEFKPYNYGPFSGKVFDFMELFESVGLVEKSNGENPEKDFDNDIFINDLLQEDDNEWAEEMLAEYKEQFIQVYALTEKGRKYVEKKLWKSLDTTKVEALNQLKRNLAEIHLKLLLKYVYTQYPNFSTESKIKEDILEETKWQF
jgi:transcription termination factor NusB